MACMTGTAGSSASYGTISSGQLSNKSENGGILKRQSTPEPCQGSHFDRNDLIRDTIIGFADGLTVPFALTAGLSAFGSTRLVIVGGLAELFAGAISMGLGAWLAATTERNACLSEESKQHCLLQSQQRLEADNICDLFAQYGISRDCALSLVHELQEDNASFVQFKLDFLLKLSKPSRIAALLSALAMGLSYFVGGLIPMIPYFTYRHDVGRALLASIGVTVVVLLIFGYTKAAVTGASRRAAFASAAQTLVVGALAAGASYGIVWKVNQRFGGD